MNSINFIVAEPFLCVPAILQIIINAVTGKNISQIEIGEHFGVNVPLNYKGKLNNIIRTDDKRQWGAIIKDDGINEFFDSFKLPLNEKYIPIYQFEDWTFTEEVKNTYLNKDKKHFVIFGVDYGYLFENRRANSVGHVTLLVSSLSVNDENYVEVYDPGPENAGIKQVKIEDLFYAIHHKNNGIWQIFY